MTKIELTQIVEHYVPIKANRESVLSAVNDYKKDSALELLQEILTKQHKSYQENIDNYMKSSEHGYNIETLDHVIDLIKEIE